MTKIFLSVLSVAIAALAVAAAEASRSIWDGVYTAEQVARGKQSYLAQCADCHGEELQGIKKASPLKGAEFFKNWKNKPVHKLIDVTWRTMPPDEPKTFTRELCTDVAAYILSENGYPTGKVELKHDAPDLRQILLTAPK